MDFRILVTSTGDNKGSQHRSSRMGMLELGKPAAAGPPPLDFSVRLKEAYAKVEARVT
jgi:hypothetical protein